MTILTIELTANTTVHVCNKTTSFIKTNKQNKK